MSSAPSLLQSLLRRLVLRLVLMLDGFLGRRAGWLRARLGRMPAGHRHRRALEAEMARLERCRAILADPDFFDDPRMYGAVAEVARVRNDPGRRALARRRIYPRLFFALPSALPAPRASLVAPDGRCTTTIEP